MGLGSTIVTVITVGAVSTRDDGVIVKDDPNITTEDVIDVTGEPELKDASKCLYFLFFPNWYQCLLIFVP